VTTRTTFARSLLAVAIAGAGVSAFADEPIQPIRPVQQINLA
jgi:hypothetical protein